MQTLIEHYMVAKDWVCRSAFADELRWQQSISFADLTETVFLREYAWVVLTSGFRESIVRKCFDFISLCFCDWESAASIAWHAPVCVNAAFPVFKNRRKLEAIAATAEIIHREGFECLSTGLLSNPTETLKTLPYIGSVTSWHLAKNLGADVAKPDRHLVSVAKRFGYNDVHLMCKELSSAVGDKVSVTDLVLWRFEERTFAY